ncbi:MAG TPA: hypothetical protein VHZ96_16750 [Frankiaceae bacterium]|jgi:hypothetical protein|nr:hypothetical protein [Frankiaceae bacterium]
MAKEQPTQLVLFGDNVVRKKPARQPIERPQQVALAAVTEFFYAQDSSSDAASKRVRALLTDLSPREVRETAIGAAWMAAAHLRYLDQLDPGVGGEMLQDFGLILAEFDDPE